MLAGSAGSSAALCFSDLHQQCVVKSACRGGQAQRRGGAVSAAAACAACGFPSSFLCASEAPIPAIPDPATTTTFVQMASMLEGGGKTPILPPQQLQDMGFKLCAYPLSLLGVSVRAMEVALEGLKRGQVPASPAMPSFQVRACGRTLVLFSACANCLGTASGQGWARGGSSCLQMRCSRAALAASGISQASGGAATRAYSRERASAGLFSSQIGDALAHPAM